VDALQVIAEPRRRRILEMVWEGEMAAGVTFGAISQHLAVLRQAGFVTVRKDGNRRLYRADRGRLEPFRQVLEAMWASALDDLADAVEAGAGRGENG